MGTNHHADAAQTSEQNAHTHKIKYIRWIIILTSRGNATTTVSWVYRLYSTNSFRDNTELGGSPSPALHTHQEMIFDTI